MAVKWIAPEFGGPEALTLPARSSSSPSPRTFPLSEAVAALELVRGGHPGGKIALIP
jgi:hypothetical protein